MTPSWGREGCNPAQTPHKYSAESLSFSFYLAGYVCYLGSALWRARVLNKTVAKCYMMPKNRPKTLRSTYEFYLLEAFTWRKTQLKRTAGTFSIVVDTARARRLPNRNRRPIVVLGVVLTHADAHVQASARARTHEVWRRSRSRAQTRAREQGGKPVGALMIAGGPSTGAVSAGESPELCDANGPVDAERGTDSRAAQKLLDNTS